MDNAPITPEGWAELLRQHDLESQQEIEQLKANARALAEEFANTKDANELAEKATNAVANQLATAITVASNLLVNADSESVKASLAKFFINAALDKNKTGDTSDATIRDLLKELSKNDPKAQVKAPTK